MNNIHPVVKIIGGLTIGFILSFGFYMLSGGGGANQDSSLGVGFTPELPVEAVDVKADRERYQNISKSELQETVQERIERDRAQAETLRSMESTDIVSLYNDRPKDSGVPKSSEPPVYQPVATEPSATPVRQTKPQPQVKTLSAGVDTKGTEKKAEESYFYTITAPGLQGTTTEEPTEVNTRATIYGSYNLKAGDKVRLRLMEPLTLPDVTIPANVVVNGIATSGGGQRLLIKVYRIEYKRSNYATDLTVFDTDGAEGLYVPQNDVNDQVSRSGTGIASGAADALTGGLYGIDEIVSGMSQVRQTSAAKIYIRDGFPVVIRLASNGANGN